MGCDLFLVQLHVFHVHQIIVQLLVLKLDYMSKLLDLIEINTPFIIIIDVSI